MCEIRPFSDVIIVATLVNLKHKRQSRMILTGYPPSSQFKPLCKLLAGCCLIVVLCLSLFPGRTVSAYDTGSFFHAPTLQVELGFQQTYRIGLWTPVFVTVNNTNATNFSGTLSISTYAGSPRTSSSDSSYWNYEEAISLHSNEQKQYTLNVPFYVGVGARGITTTANLLNAAGNLVATQQSAHGYEVKPGDLFIGTLSDPNA